MLQVAEPARLAVPARQAWHAPFCAAEKKPAGQGRTRPAPRGQYDPAGQGCTEAEREVEPNFEMRLPRAVCSTIREACLKPLAREPIPLCRTLQAACPDKSWKVPLAQGSQASHPAALKVPALHGWQALACAPPKNGLAVPARHSVHATAPFAAEKVPGAPGMCGRRGGCMV